jgi:putative ABC transport system substrate-binding protein
MSKTILSLALCAVLLTVSFPAEAQQPTKVPRIGYLGGTSSTVSAHNLEAFRQGLHDLGYVEGKNLVMEYRFAEGRNERFPALAAELLRTNVEVIVSAGGNGARAAQQVTSDLPIVFVANADPVASRLVASLARPGGNVTGLTNFAPELTGKRLELLKESAPKVSRVAVLLNPENASSAGRWKEADAVGQLLRVRLQAVEIRSTEDFERP